MKLLSNIFFLATVFCLTTVSAFAQNTTYVDANYKPATVANYTYKRVIKYVKPIINPNVGTGYYGGITSNPQPSGLHVCSLIDYYKTGEPALVLNVITLNLNCSDWSPDGMAIYYFKSGDIKRKEPYKTGKLHGTVINYDESGNETKREEYENGKLLGGNKYAVPADSPLVGKWKYEERSASYGIPGYSSHQGSLTKLITANFSSNGILEITVQELFVNNQSFSNVTEKTNWKYIPKGSSSGVLEQYQGDDLQFRGSVRWISSNQFEYINTFHTNPEAVGTKLLYTKQ